MEIGPYLNLLNQSELSGNVIDLCPVGALTDKTFRFKNRVWFTKPVDAHRNCTTPGCCGKATLWLRGEEVFRVTARKDEWGEVQSYDGKPGWICNTCRFETKKTESWTIEGVTTISRHSVIGANKYNTTLVKPNETVKKVMKGVEPKLLMDIHSVSGVNNPNIHLSDINGPAHSGDFKK
jgi:NADH-quinone oxidoreductase subunit G